MISKASVITSSVYLYLDTYVEVVTLKPGFSLEYKKNNRANITLLVFLHSTENQLFESNAGMPQQALQVADGGGDFSNNCLIHQAIDGATSHPPS